ncbi:hypothetical protein GJ496_006809 [Pomphorhynchus laevis]|nr:hypothetical protein GJ496_006809 [Pomphorhynchus laevis]
MIRINLIFACDIRNGISKNNVIPWNIPKDLKVFRETTLSAINTSHQLKKNVVIMGRKTWEAIPVKHRPLKYRYNIVISNILSALEDECKPDYICNSLQKALSWIQQENNFERISKVFVIGGSRLYNECLVHPNIGLIFCTQILKDFKCDNFINIEWNKFVDLKYTDPELEDFPVYATAIKEGKLTEDSLEYQFKCLKITY